MKLQFSLIRAIAAATATCFCTALVARADTPNVLPTTSVAPKAPAGLTVTAAYRQTTLCWSASIGATAYAVYRSTAPGKEEDVPIAAGLISSPFIETGLTNGTHYYYKVRAVNSAGLSATSAEASAIPAVSMEPGYYLVTYWAGNDTPLVQSVDGDYVPTSHALSSEPVPATTIFVYQPKNINDAPPPTIIQMSSIDTGQENSPASKPASAPTVRIHYDVVAPTGISFTEPDTLFPPRDSAIQVAPPAAATPGLTPYQQNPFLFAGRKQAMRALNSPDILMRRSGVEWLADWTQADGGGGPPGRDAFRAQFSKMTSLVPALTRAVSEMPKQDSQQAAHLLLLMGTHGRAAIPAVCAALASPDYGDGVLSHGDDFVARANLLSDLVRLCGGPDRLTSTLTKLLHNKEPETRLSVASALGYCTDPTFRHISPPPVGAYPYMSGTEDEKWQRAFLAQVVPALALRLDDQQTAVRLASAQSLERLTWATDDAPWHLAVPPLAHASASPDAALRLSALRVLAFMPGDVSPASASLRSALQGGDVERSYALAALSHAADSNRAYTLSVFLPDLTVANPTRRHTAASDIRLLAAVFWTGGFPYPVYPLPEWYDDSRLSRASTPPDATTGASQTRLLAALAQAVTDTDPAVRDDAALALEQIGTAAVTRARQIPAFSDSYMRYLIAIFSKTKGTVMPIKQAPMPNLLKVNPGPKASEVVAALTLAASSIQSTDPTLAKRLADLGTRL